jgi:hypothetical protein
MNCTHRNKKLYLMFYFLHKYRISPTSMLRASRVFRDAARSNIAPHASPSLLARRWASLARRSWKCRRLGVPDVCRHLGRPNCAGLEDVMRDRRCAHLAPPVTPLEPHASCFTVATRTSRGAACSPALEVPLPLARTRALPSLAL